MSRSAVERRRVGPLLAIAGSALAASCAAATTDDPESALRRRVCESVVTAYRVGLRPSAIEVEVPALTAGDPPSTIHLTGAHLPLAEQCLGLPIPGQQPTRGNAPRPPPAPRPSASPPGSATPPDGLLDTRT